MIQPDGPIQRSPLTQAAPGSLLASPAQSATRSPNFAPHGQTVSPNFGPIPPQQQQQQPLRPQPPRSNFTPMMAPQRSSLMANQSPSNGISGASTVGSSASGITQSSGSSNFYQTQFTDHMVQLGKLTPFFFRFLGIELCNPRLISCCRAGVRGSSRHLRSRRTKRPICWPRSIPAAKLPAIKYHATPPPTGTKPSIYEPGRPGTKRRRSCIPGHEQQSPLRPLRPYARRRPLWTVSKHAFPYAV